VLNITERDLTFFQVTKGTGVSAYKAAKIASFLSIYGLEIKDIIAMAVASEPGGPTVTAFARVSDLIDAGVSPTVDLRLSFCAQACPYIEDNDFGYVEARGKMDGLTIVRKMKAAMGNNGLNAMNAVIDVAQDYVNAMADVPGVTKPSAAQIVLFSPTVINPANATAAAILRGIGL
jgi:hypothetical protein